SDLADVINGLNAGRAGAPQQSQAVGSQVAQLVEQMHAGEVGVLLIDAPNPAYTLPGGLRFAEAMRRVETTVSFSSVPDETANLASFVLPDHHFLEAWGDYSPEAGVTEIVQPSMRPVFNTKQVGDVLLSIGRQ